MKDLSVSLEEHFLNFIEGEIASGRYKNADEVIREGLQILEARQKNFS